MRLRCALVAVLVALASKPAAAEDRGATLVSIGWMSAAVGLGFAGAGGVLLGVGTSRLADGEARCPEAETCADVDARALADSGRELQLHSAWAFAVGGGGLVAAAVLWGIGYRASSEARVRVTPVGEGAALTVTW